MKKILIFDIETTGFLEKGGLIVEIGMVELNLLNGEKKIVFDSMCWEDGMSEEIFEKSWISKNSNMCINDFKNSPNLKTIKNKIQKIINSYPNGCTAYNNQFDFGFFENRGFKFPVKLDCPMRLSTDICKLPARQGPGWKWPKVQEAYDIFFPESNYIEEHRGADDAMHEAEIIYELYLRGVFKVR